MALGTSTVTQKLRNILRNIKEPIDLDFIMNELVSYKHKCYMLNILYIVDNDQLPIAGSERNLQKLYKRVLHVFKSNDSNMLCIAFQVSNFDGINLMFTYFKIPPTINLFQALITQGNNRKEASRIINVMIANGLILTLADIMDAVSHKIVVPKAREFLSDKEKEQLAAHCLQVHFFEYTNILGISQETADMYRYCTAHTSSLSIVKRLVKRGIMPDDRAFKYACENPHQRKLVGFLLDYIKPTSENFTAMCNIYDKTGTLAKMDAIVNSKRKTQVLIEDDDSS